MTATDWDLHPWARKLEPCGLVATCDERDWQKIVDDYRAQGADLHERFAVWVRIVDDHDGPRVLVFLNPDFYSHDDITEALDIYVKPWISRCLELGPYADDWWAVSVDAAGRPLYDMCLLGDDREPGRAVGGAGDGRAGLAGRPVIVDVEAVAPGEPCAGLRSVSEPGRQGRGHPLVERDRGVVGRRQRATGHADRSSRFRGDRLRHRVAAFARGQAGPVVEAHPVGGRPGYERR